MSTLIVAVVLVSIIALITLLFINIEKRKKQNHMSQFLACFTTYATTYSLNFSGQEILNEAAIGLDGIQRKLLVINRNEKTEFVHHLLHLEELKNCFVKKQYGTINAAGLKAAKLDQYLEKITLCLEQNNGDIVEVPFFHHVSNSVYQISELEEKAKHWQMMLSKMLKRSSQAA